MDSQTNNPLGRIFFDFTKLPIVLFLFLAVSLVHCTPPPDPGLKTASVDTLKAPTFNDFANHNVAQFTTTQPNYTLNGTCDSAVATLEYSTDNHTWSPVPQGCNTAGKFQLDLIVENRLVVYCRARLEDLLSLTAIANVSLIIPPTYRLVELVSSSRLDPEGPHSTQNTMSSSLGGVWSSNTQITIFRGTLGVTYGQ